MPVRPRECVARVTATRVLTPDVLEADLAMVEPATLAFDAGQWVSVPFGPKTVRASSLASSPRAPALITLCADVAPGGIGSAWFRGLRPGQDVRFKGPLGGFVLDPGDARRLVLVAEEIGIVPIRSIAGELAAAGFERPTTLVYSARDPGWLVYDADLRRLSEGRDRHRRSPPRAGRRPCGRRLRAADAQRRRGARHGRSRRHRRRDGRRQRLCRAQSAPAHRRRRAARPARARRAAGHGAGAVAALDHQGRVVGAGDAP